MDRRFEEPDVAVCEARWICTLAEHTPKSGFGEISGTFHVTVRPRADVFPRGRTCSGRAGSGVEHEPILDLQGRSTTPEYEHEKRSLTALTVPTDFAGDMLRDGL